MDDLADRRTLAFEISDNSIIYLSTMFATASTSDMLH